MPLTNIPIKHFPFFPWNELKENVVFFNALTATENRVKTVLKAEGFKFKFKLVSLNLWIQN